MSLGRRDPSPAAPAPSQCNELQRELLPRIRPLSAPTPAGRAGTCIAPAIPHPFGAFPCCGVGTGLLGGAKASCRRVWGGRWHPQWHSLCAFPPSRRVAPPGFHIRGTQASCAILLAAMGTRAGPIAFLRRTQGTGLFGAAWPCLALIPRHVNRRGYFLPLPIPISFIFPAKERLT